MFYNIDTSFEKYTGQKFRLTRPKVVKNKKKNLVKRKTGYKKKLL
jgi:hypothetical protein